MSREEDGEMVIKPSKGGRMPVVIISGLSVKSAERSENHQSQHSESAEIQENISRYQYIVSEAQKLQ